MMKSKLTLMSTILAASLWSGQALYAHEKAGAGHEAMEEHAGAGSAKGALDALDAHLDSVNADLNAGKLDRIHEHAEAMNAAIKDLDKDPALDAAKKKRVAGYIKNIAKLTDSMHDAADEKKAEEAKKWARKLSAQAELLDKQFAGGAPKAKADRGPDSAHAAHP